MFHSITLHVEHCHINEGESVIAVTWTAGCACGVRPSCCMFSSGWTVQSHLNLLASPAGGLTFNYQHRGSMSQLHSGRHICFPVPLQHDLEGHREA